MKYVFIILILSCLTAGTVFAADPVTNPDQYDRSGFLPQGQESSATCGAKGLIVCHGTCIAKEKICLNVPIAGHNTFDSFQEYFQAIYSFILGAVAILSTVMVMWGGFKWLTSRGSSGDIGEAKKIIWSSIIGLVLAFLSFTILYLVNPKLTVIGLPELKTVNLSVQEANLISQNSPSWARVNPGIQVPCDSSGSSIVGQYDFSRYATNCDHIPQVRKFYDQMNGKINSAEDAQKFIDQFAPNSPVTGQMVMNAGADPAVIIAEMIQDSSIGTAGIATRTNNPGNVGNWGTRDTASPVTTLRNDQEGWTQISQRNSSGTTTFNERTYDSWEAGVRGIGTWLNDHKS